ncbi:MAG: hypothetical protein HYY40_04305 [Bacteroidetes bacterium]|nr:hypothetical protein [Bacteroidota bacterium]
MSDILAHGIKWEITNEIAFKEPDQELKEELYLVAKRKKEKYRVRIGVVQINMGVLGAYSIKDILIGIGFRSVGVVGISKQHPANIRVKCPHCRTIQTLQKEWQKCLNCGKGFYLFDDNW